MREYIRLKNGVQIPCLLRSILLSGSRRILCDLIYNIEFVKLLED